MLGIWTSHKSYVYFVLSELKELVKIRPDQIREHLSAIEKMLIFDLDPLEAVIEPLYPRSVKWQCGKWKFFVRWCL